MKHRQSKQIVETFSFWMEAKHHYKAKSIRWDQDEDIGWFCQIQILTQFYQIQKKTKSWLNGIIWKQWIHEICI